MFSEHPTPAQLGSKARVILPLIIGTISGLFVLLFAMANDDWIIVYMPNPPWHAEPSWPAFESRLWAVMLASCLSGIALAIGSLYVIQRVRGRRRKNYIKRIEALENELDKTNRLLAATRKTR